MHSTITLSCLVFLIYLLLLPMSPEAMFTDPDTYWHMASGDLIRSIGTIPESDPWSLSAGTERWYNISWLWDIMLNYAYQQGGWGWVVMMNSITIAATLALIFANCLIRSGSGISAFTATTLLPFTVMNVSIRPFQFSAFFIAVMMLILRPVAKRTMSMYWLLIIPIIMILWVNIHGGFLVAFSILGCYGLEALVNKERKLFVALFATGALSLLTCLINPYGIHMITGILRTMNSDGASSIIAEWKPLNFSSHYFAQIFYLLLFLILVRPVMLAKNEKWLIYSWLLLGLHAVRHLAIFGVVSAPALALGLRQNLLVPPATPRPVPKAIEQLAGGISHLMAKGKTTFVMALLCIGLTASLFTPFSRHQYRLESLNPLPDLSQEITYLEKNRPHGRFLNSYNLGGPLIFLTHGQIPVFIDGREKTAYPDQISKDYIAFHDASPGWTGIFERYHLDGAIMPNGDNEFMDRFINRKGWHLAFKGPTASIFLRDKP